jgi:excinuclease ABC subunit B
MQRALAETDRRRDKQVEFNKVHGITPKGIEKAVTDIMEGAHAPAPGQVRGRRVGEPKRRYAKEIPEDPVALGKLLKKLEEQMFQHARDLEFEEAAAVRDELHAIRQERLFDGELGGLPSG